MIEPTEPTTTPTPSPSRFRFTLRTVFVVMAVVGGVLAVFIPYAGCLEFFFALLVVAAGWSYLRGNTEGSVGGLVVLGVFWLALQLFGPYTSLRNRVIFVVGTERLQQWAIETLDHSPPAKENGNIVLEANDLPEGIRTLAGTYNVVLSSEDGSPNCILFKNGSLIYRWGLVMARPGYHPPLNWRCEKIADGIWGFRSGLLPRRVEATNAKPTFRGNRRMSMVTGFEFVLVLLVVLAVALAWHWWRQPPSHAPLPSPFCDRDSQEAEWRARYQDEYLETADAVLLLVCDAFCFNPDERYKFQPDDQIMGVYRGCYPPGKRWPRADCMEMETLMHTFNKKFLTESSQWHADITLAELVDLAYKQRHVNADSSV